MNSILWTRTKGSLRAIDFGDEGIRMSVTAVKEYLQQWGKEKSVLEFPVSSATVELAAKAVGCEPARIAKTLSFKKDDGCVLVVAAGDARIKSSKFKAAFGTKASMMNPEETLAFTGHVVGGVCPFAITNQTVQVFLDVSLRRFETVFPACGSANSAIETTCDELFMMARAVDWVDVCSSWNGEEGFASITQKK